MERTLWLSAAVVAMVAGAAGAAEPLRQVLTSAAANVRVEAWEARARDVTPGCPAAWSVRKVTLHGGKQEGVDLVVVHNGAMEFTVVPTRGMGLLAATLGDVRLGWDSPVREVVHPQFVNLQGRGGLGWLDGFNEWMCRCGLESNGHPGTDRFINNVGAEATMELTLHGKVANLPASEVEVVIDRVPPYRIRVRGRVDERMFYGPKLELATEISTEPGTATVRVADVITNRGGQEQEFQIIYHTNYGRPLLEAGSTFVAPVERITPFNDRAAEGLAAYDQYGPPQAGYIEQVYCLRLFGDADGRTLAMLRNRARDRAVSVAYSVRELACFNLWKNTVAELEGCVTGLEPGTNFSHNRFFERKFGRVPRLAPGASHRATVDFTVHVGADAVQAAADRIAALQGGRKPTVDPKPETLD